MGNSFLHVQSELTSWIKHAQNLRRCTFHLNESSAFRTGALGSTIANRPKRVSTESAPSTLETRLGDFASIEKMAGNFRIADDPG